MTSVESITETPERVFYVKSRPQGADIIDIVRAERRVFIGYPPWRSGARYDPAKISSCILNLRSASDGWKDETESYHQTMKTNRQFAQSVDKGWIVAVPRPGEGICWLGEIAGPFELIENPS